MFRLTCWAIARACDVLDRLLRGPRALTIRDEGDRLVLDVDPSGRRLGARANLPIIGRVSLRPGRRARRAGWSALPVPEPGELRRAIERGTARARDTD